MNQNRVAVRHWSLSSNVLTEGDFFSLAHTRCSTYLCVCVCVRVRECHLSKNKMDTSKFYSINFVNPKIYSYNISFTHMKCVRCSHWVMHNILEWTIGIFECFWHTTQRCFSRTFDIIKLPFLHIYAVYRKIPSKLF